MVSTMATSRALEWEHSKVAQLESGSAASKGCYLAARTEAWTVLERADLKAARMDVWKENLWAPMLVLRQAAMMVLM